MEEDQEAEADHRFGVGHLPASERRATESVDAARIKTPAVVFTCLLLPFHVKMAFRSQHNHRSARSPLITCYKRRKYGIRSLTSFFRQVALRILTPSMKYGALIVEFFFGVSVSQ